MESNIYIKRPAEETKPENKELMKYMSSLSSNDEHGLIDTAGTMRKVRKSPQ